VEVTRSIIEVLAACNHPLTITTKGALADRDIDLLAPMAKKNLVRVYISIAMLDKDARAQARSARSGAGAASRNRQGAVVRGDPHRRNGRAGDPGLTDKDLESVLEAAAAHGATGASWIMLRLPREVAPLFREWLDAHYPLRAAHVMSLVNQIRGGRDNDPNFGARMRGSGQFAELIKRRFKIAVERLGLTADRKPLDTSLFRPPQAAHRGSRCARRTIVSRVCSRAR
jgi:DNA repair photolyase